MGRRKEVLNKAVEQLEGEGITAFAVNGDVRKYDDCQRSVADTVAKFGKLDILCFLLLFNFYFYSIFILLLCEDILVNGAAGNFLCAPEDLSVNGFKTGK